MTRDPSGPEHPLADALGLAAIGPTAIHRADGSLVGAVQVQCRHVDLRGKPGVSEAVVGLTQASINLPDSIQILVRNRAFDPTRHLSDLARH